MSKIIKSLFLFCLLFAACNKNDDNLYQAEGYIVGFDPCTIRHNYDIGYVIISSNLKDTLLTYNFPDTIYNFPKEYFQNYVNSGYFPSTARYEFHIHITYSIAKEDESIYHLCATDINMSEFYKAIQVIIKIVSKY